MREKGGPKDRLQEGEQFPVDLGLRLSLLEFESTNPKYRTSYFIIQRLENSMILSPNANNYKN